MNKSANLIVALGLCVLCAASAQAQLLYDANQPQAAGVQMTLTHLSVNEQTLDLSWKIKNNTDHEVWICDSLDSRSPSVFEWFLDEDARTLVIRRRFGLPVRITSRERYNPAGQYVRLLAGQEKAESTSIALPVEPRRMFSGESGNAEYAEHLTLEIGFYDESLPALILEIVRLAEHFKIDLGVGSYGFRDDVHDRFFGGRWIAALFKSNFQDFGSNVRSADASGGMWIFHMDEIDMGEKVLRAEVDGVSIPYKSNYPPLAEPEAPTDVTMALTKLDVNDTNLELGWKITNNTDHDVWICSSLGFGSSTPSYERFLDRDSETLMIRRRFGLRIEEGVLWEWPYRKGQYVRLRPGQEKAESLSGPLPVPPNPVFVKYSPDAQDAGRLVLEIGFFSEDLQDVVLRIVELAEKICDLDPKIGVGNLVDLVDPFFGGWAIARNYNTDSTFRDSIISGEGPIVMPYGSALGIHEEFLRIEVDNVSIPYGFPHLRGQ